MAQQTTTNAVTVQSSAPSTSSIDIFDLSYLEFVYSHSKATGGEIRKKLYFPDYPQITESRKANYAKYTPISRNSAIPYYLGSESRSFKLEVTFSYQALYNKKDILNSLLIKHNTNNNSFQSDQNRTGALYSDPATIYGKTSPVSLALLSQDYLTNGLTAQSLIFYYLQLIRTSVVNNAENPTEGPPVIRLNYGSLYSDVPCVCTDYNIQEDQVVDAKAKGTLIDPITKMYPFYRVSMTLEEVRLGNYLKTEFNPTDTVSRDNIVGWEQIIDASKSGSFDPITPILRN